MAASGTWMAAARLAARYAAFRVGEPRRRRRSLDERLAALPRTGLPLGEPLRIRWNDHHVPFVEAASDRDLAVGLGVVHAHLRLFQIEAMRRLAWGRLAEVVGPPAVDIDRSLRIIGFARPVAALERALPPATREWLEGFRDGLNAVIDTGPLPEEFRCLGLRPERWSVADLLAISRLSASDFSWKVLRRLLPHSHRPDWPAAWKTLLAEGSEAVPALAGDGPTPPLGEELLASLTRGGSNALAVSAERSAGGGALIASDPHLGVLLPNVWLIAGMRSPGTQAVGLMIPGVPLVALGRNRHIAWGGTSLHASSSDLFDVSDLPEAEIAERREPVRVRWGREAAATVRETAFGPIISDAPLLGLPADRRLALRWIGHDANDPITAMLGVARARDWDGFRAALDGFPAPAQTMVYADTEGQVGRAVAAHLPRRPARPPEDVVQTRQAQAHWQEIATSRDFPAVFRPDEGFVASANNRPRGPSEVPVGFFFSPDDRVRRIAALIEQAGPVTADALKALQRDRTIPSAADLRDRMLSHLDPQAAQAPAVVRALAGWDGRHDAASRGALAFELLVHHLLHRLYPKEELDLWLSGWDLWAVLRRALEAEDGALATKARQAARTAEADFRRHRRWGDLHRLHLAHPFGRLPGRLGRRFRFVDEPVGGGNESLMKTAHGVSRSPHRVVMGSVARHVSDLADPDANDFCLLGGQDGWLGSDGFLDQLPLWREGRYIRVPLTAPAVATAFSRETLLHPAGEAPR